MGFSHERDLTLPPAPPPPVYFVIIENKGRYFFARTKGERPNRQHNIEWRHKHDDASQFVLPHAEAMADRFANVRATYAPVEVVLRAIRHERQRAA